MCSEVVIALQYSTKQVQAEFKHQQNNSEQLLMKMKITWVSVEVHFSPFPQLEFFFHLLSKNKEFPHHPQMCYSSSIHSLLVTLFVLSLISFCKFQWRLCVAVRRASIYTEMNIVHGCQYAMQNAQMCLQACRHRPLSRQSHNIPEHWTYTGLISKHFQPQSPFLCSIP